jgi:hypothetical protein
MAAFHKTKLQFNSEAEMPIEKIIGVEKVPD